MSRRRNRGRPRDWRDKRRTQQLQGPLQAADERIFAIATDLVGSDFYDQAQPMLVELLARHPADKLGAGCAYSLAHINGDRWLHSRDKFSAVATEWLSQAVYYTRLCAHLVPRSAEVRLLHGEYLYCLLQLPEARQEFTVALQLAPKWSAKLHQTLGNCCLGLGERKQAEEHWNQVLALPASEVPAEDQGSACETLLRRCEFRRAYELYEWRFDSPSIQRRAKHPLFRPEQRRWRGERIEGRLWICGENGVGDVMQHARFVPLARARVGALTLEVHPELVNLLRAQWDDVTVVPFGVERGEFDCWALTESLPHALGGIERWDDLPHAPYLRAPKEFRRLEGNLRVGLRWWCSPVSYNALHRATLLRDWLPVLQVPGVTFYSLQLENAAAQVAELGDAAPPIIDLGPELRDWCDTAAVLKELDLVIAVDCSVANLAGALGVPLWVCVPAIPDYKWVLDGPASPWYSTARLFRQRRVHEWGPVFQEIASELQRVVEARGLTLHRSETQ